MIAMLGMYDPVPLRGVNDRFWHGIRAELGFGPQALTRDMGFFDVWQSPDLLFAQTCGMPLRQLLHRQVTLIGTPHYDLPGLAPGHYTSCLVVRAGASGGAPGDFTAGRFAYNQAMSQSGWSGPMAYLDNMGITFGSFVETGSHAASALAVGQGRADIAGLDSLSWEMLREHDPDLAARLKVIDTTPPTPTLPFITARTRDPAPIAAAVRRAIAGLSEGDRRALHLQGLVDIPLADYLAVATPPGPQAR